MFTFPKFAMHPSVMTMRAGHHKRKQCALVQAMRTPCCANHLERSNLGAKVHNIVHSGPLSRGQQHLLVHREGLNPYKSLLDGGCAAGAGGEEEAPPSLQQRGLSGVLHPVISKSCASCDLMLKERLCLHDLIMMSHTSADVAPAAAKAKKL